MTKNEEIPIRKKGEIKLSNNTIMIVKRFNSRGISLSFSYPGCFTYTNYVLKPGYVKEISFRISDGTKKTFTVGQKVNDSHTINQMWIRNDTTIFILSTPKFQYNTPDARSTIETMASQEPTENEEETNEMHYGPPKDYFIKI